MKIKTELLNFLTGILLLVSGALNLWRHDFVLGMNWIIFGSMYLIMDDYLQNERYGSLLEKMTDFGRRIFSWVGFLGSIVLLGHYLFF